jgi:hypothetical protein
VQLTASASAALASGTRRGRKHPRRILHKPKYRKRQIQ